MKYNSRYSILVYAAQDCLIYDDKENCSVEGKLFPSVKDARWYLRNVLKQRPCSKSKS